MGLRSKALAIVGMTIVAAIVYGVVHDQFTARICVEYFTVGHPPVFDTEDPTLLGLGWGVIATWWVGAVMGPFLALAALAGKRPKRSVRSLIRPLAMLLVVTGACAALAGVIGNHAAEAGQVRLSGALADAIPAEKHTAFITDLWVHSASYLVGFVGGIVLIVTVYRSRRRLAHDDDQRTAVDPGDAACDLSRG